MSSLLARFRPALRPLFAAFVLLAAAPAPAATLETTTTAPRPGTDRKFETPESLRTEAKRLIDLLEQVHYNRDAVHAADYDQVVGDFMGELDGHRLFFLSSDKTEFKNRYSKNLYWNVKNLGNIDAAYEIYSVYEKRANARINWIFTELGKDIDLNSTDYYRADRTKAEWPDDATAADDLWRKRLKFEILAEVLNKKPVEEAKQVVRKRYERMLKNIAETEGGDLAEVFLSTIAHLYDPHSTYFSADTYEDFGIQMKLQLVGIGALLGLEEDNCVVKEIIPGGPADLSKQLRPNDKIISVSQTGGDPVEILGMKLRKIVEMIRGPKGTQVHLVVHPADATDPAARKEIVLTRDLVKLNSARAHAAIFEVPDRDGKISPLGVITLPAFYGANDGPEAEGEKTSASKDVADLLERLQKAGIKGLVLDLRHNGGGLLSEAIELTGLFIEKGPVVQVKDYESRIDIDTDDDPKIAYSGPLAVLVDRFSASASEIVAGALQNYGRAVVIGDSSTHGKGSVQTIVEMGRFVKAPVKTGATKLTIQKFYLPSGSSTQLKGVVPDIVLPSVDDYLPIGESDLPHALVWDEIPSSYFSGKPLDPRVLTPLRENSRQRQANLEEFSFLKKNIDWFKGRQEEKLVSLNANLRRQQKEADDAFRKEIKSERERLAKDDFSFQEVRLGPPPPPKVKPAKKADAKDEDDDEDELSTDENESYGKVDIPLRESLRVVNDALALGRDPKFLASDHPPLTAIVSKNG
jgi:carboxyl-terminal processing protease